MKDLPTHKQEYCAQYCAIHQLDRIRRNALSHYLDSFVRWMAVTANVIRPDQMTSENILSWHRHVASRPTARSGLPQQAGSIYTEIRTVYRFCGSLHEGGYISDSVLQGFPAMRPPPRNLQIGLRHLEVREYLESLPMNTPEDFTLRAMAEFFYSTGVRATEALNLDLQSISESERTVKVLGKGRKERIVPIGRTAMRHLEIYLTGIRPRLLRRVDQPSLWLNGRGVRVGYTTLRGWFSDRDHADVRRIRPHMLRRACATELLRSGADVWAIKELLGHDDLQTLEHYALLDLADLKEMHVRCHPRDRATLGKSGPGTLE